MFVLHGYMQGQDFWPKLIWDNTQLNELIFLTKSSNVSDELSHALLSGDPFGLMTDLCHIPCVYISYWNLEVKWQHSLAWYHRKLISLH